MVLGLMKHASILIVVVCLLSASALSAYAAKLVDEEEIYQTGRKEHRTVPAEKKTQFSTQTIPEKSIKTTPATSGSSVKTKTSEKKKPQSTVVKINKDDSVGQSQGNIFALVWHWISQTYSGSWVPVWNRILLLIGILCFVKLAAEISIRLR